MNGERKREREQVLTPEAIAMPEMELRFLLRKLRWMRE
jgi:hypothetical protein